MLILASMDTTSNGGALMLHYLATHPGRAGGDRGASRVTGQSHRGIPAADLTSTQHARGVGTDTEFLGQHLKSGDVVLLHWMAANRDPGRVPSRRI